VITSNSKTTAEELKAGKQQPRMTTAVLGVVLEGRIRIRKKKSTNIIAICSKATCLQPVIFAHSLLIFSVCTLFDASVPLSTSN
jgi:hypothetical protein